MPSSNDTFYNLKRLHLIFLACSAVLLGVTVWMLVVDHRRPWKAVQREYFARIGETNKPLAIRQIWLPELTLDYNFSQVARFDRCGTCHLGIDEPPAVDEELPPPYLPHPRQELFVGATSPHPMNEFGCTICHDGQGSATDFRLASHSPDNSRQAARWREEFGWRRNPHWGLPMLPKKFSQSRCLTCHHEVDDLRPSDRFPDPPAEKLVEGRRLIGRLGCFGCHEIGGFDASGRRVGPDMRLESVAAEENTPPGTMRKVGPALHETSEKLGKATLLDWIRDPRRFLPTARMPRFYGNDEHLEGAALGDDRRFESVEIRAMATYLRGTGLSMLMVAPDQTAEPASVERGKQAFVLHGCLACHKHADFSDGKATLGPDLSRVGAKYDSENGAAWLADWLSDPQRHSPRTLMPDPLLDLEPIPAEEGEPTPPMADPAADMAAYLMASKDDYRPAELPPLVEKDLDDLARIYLEDMGAEEVIERYPTDGILDAMVSEFIGLPDKTLDRTDEDLGLLDANLGPPDDHFGPTTQQRKLFFVGRQTIRRRGCYACHDIPGFEDTPSIGPELSDWGRKHVSLLAFGQVHEFLVEQDAADDGAGEGDPVFFTEAVREHRREGFLWQKLRLPRSFDYRADGKPYDERLTMPRFDLTPEQREAVMTFVLGLVADPPSERYVARPTGRRRAIVEGQAVLEKYACAECHTLEMERWTFRFDPEEFFDPIPTDDYAFMKPHFPPERIVVSTRTNEQGLATAQVVGMPRLDASGHWLEDEDDDGNPLYFFALWEPAVINGQVWPTGGAEVMISRPQLIGRQEPVGGAAARLMFPAVLDRAKAMGSVAVDQEAWGWLPPPLLGEGRKVRAEWLRDYLLDPTPIRPAAVLRMPQYNLSEAEASKLADYFAAVDDREPEVFLGNMGILGDVRAMEAWRRDRMDDAWKILTDRKTFCAKCHVIGDYSPGGAVSTILAPDLEHVGHRIRPEFLRRWLAHPKAVLPYTGMPVNFPPSGDPLGQDLFPSSSSEQLEAVGDLLLNYDDYLRSRTSIRELIENR